MQRSKKVLKKESEDQAACFYGPNSAQGLPVCNAWSETRELGQESRWAFASTSASSGVIGNLDPTPTSRPPWIFTWIQLLALIQTASNVFKVGTFYLSSLHFGLIPQTLCWFFLQISGSSRFGFVHIIHWLRLWTYTPGLILPQVGSNRRTFL